MENFHANSSRSDRPVLPGIRRDPGCRVECELGAVGIRVDRCFGTTVEGNYIEDFGNAAGTKTAYGLQATLQGDAASVISGNKVFDFNADSKATRYIYIGVTAVNYGVGELAIVGNSVRGNSRTSDTGLSYSVGNGQA